MAPAQQGNKQATSLRLADNFDTLTYTPEPSEKTLRFTNGDVYQGETFADLRHGQGRHFCSNGDTHEGGWYKGMRHGPGTATFARGFHYKGDFQYDHAHGMGKAKYENGSVYEGEFANDNRSGWGVQYFPDESSYEGEWEDDKMQGNGRLTLKDGSYYEGTWNDGQCRSGVWRSKDGRQEYKGEWVDGRKAGRGVMLVSGMFHYEGEWKDDVQEGHGKCRWIDGSVYDGSWQDGQRQGKGKLVRADGYKFDGQWLFDKEHGQGNARMSNGDRYHGEFKEGAPEGIGRSRSLDGDRYEGEWRQGKKSGQGRIQYASGDKYQGEWVNDKRHGHGICHFANGNVFRGEWQDDHWLQSEAEPSLCKVAGSGLSKCVAGEQASFVILARDNLGNKRLTGGDSFLVWLEGPDTVHGNVVDQEDGSFMCTYTAKIAGMYELYITNETGESVAEAPFPLRAFAAPADPRMSVIRRTRGPKAFLDNPVKFLVELRDCYDNRCAVSNAAEELPIQCEARCGGTSCEVDIKSGRSGTHQCSFVPKVAGFYRISATSGGWELKHSPISVQVLDPAAPVRDPEADAKVEDVVKDWETKAAQQYQEDGRTDGWESDEAQPETAEQKYIREHPDVPVVERLEDMWKVTKLQRERKKIQEKARAMAEMAELQSNEEVEEIQHPQRAPMIGRILSRSASNRSRTSSASLKQMFASPRPRSEKDQLTSDLRQKSPANSVASTGRVSPERQYAGGVQSLDPEQSMFSEDSKRQFQAGKKKSSLKVDQSGMFTQLSEISNVSSLSSRFTQASIDRKGVSSCESDPYKNGQ